MKNFLSYGTTALFLGFTACSDMPTSTSEHDDPAFSQYQPGSFETLSKIDLGPFTTANSNGDPTPALTISTPAVSTGDFMIAQVVTQGLNTARFICTPTGWTSILRTNSEDKVSVQTFWKTATGAEPASVEFQFRVNLVDCGTANNPASVKALGGIIAYTDVDVAHVSGPIFASLGAFSGDATSIDAPSIDAVPAGSRVVRFFGAEKKDNLITTAGSGSSTIYSIRNIKNGTDPQDPSAATADAEQAADGATGTVTGSQGGTNTKWAAQTVVLRAANTAPTLSNVPEDTTVCEGVELTFDANATDEDFPAQTLTFSLEGTVPAGASINSSTGVFTWTPGEDQDGGPYTFKVRVTDDGVPPLFDESEISITVSEANTAPVLDPIGNQGVIAEQLLSFTATASDTDEVGGSPNTLTFSLEGTVPAGASINASTGLFEWTPTALQVGPHSVTIRVTDDGPGGDCGTAALYDEETITITVEAIPVDGTIIVDIKPGGELNSINCTNPNGVIPVAILSSATFDATTVDHTTVLFEGASEAHVHKKTGVVQRHEEDVNGDDLTDLVFHFLKSATALTCDSVSGILTGETFGGAPIEGVDGVNMH